MSMPPQPGPWGPGPQPPGPQQPPPPGYYTPQQPWGPPQPPQKQGSGLKWLLIAVAVLLVIAISVGVTLFVTRSSGNGSTTASPTAGNGIASANDTGPVSIITTEPTCTAWWPISNSLTQVQSNGWQDRDPSIPAKDWTAEQKSQYESVGKAMRLTADQAVALARQTPNRVVREVYEQFIAFSRAYADSIPTYSAVDDYLALTNIAASFVLDSICNSIAYGSATAQAVSVSPITPSAVAPTPQDLSNPQRFVASPSAECSGVVSRRDKLISDTSDWAKLDPKISATDWSADQRAVMQQAGQTMTSFANDVESVGKTSSNGAFQDFAFSAAIYFRAYVNSIPSYTSADNYLVVAGSRLNNILVNACKAAS